MIRHHIRLVTNLQRLYTLRLDILTVSSFATEDDECTTDDSPGNTALASRFWLAGLR